MGIWGRVLVLSLGGALGANARYWLGLGMARWAGPRFPWSTVAINVSGSFAVGVAAVLLAHRWPHPLARLFVVTGFLGGYTTFSAFALESAILWERGDRGLSAANTLGSVALGLSAVVGGVSAGRAMVGAPVEIARPGPPENPVDPADRHPLPWKSDQPSSGPPESHPPDRPS